MPTANDKAWEKYITRMGISLDGTTYRVTASKLKQVAEREPRLMAKIDTPKQLPAIFHENGYAVMAVANGEYLLFKGNMFATISDCQTVGTLKSHLPFPLLTVGRGTGESEYLDNAFNTGLLTEFTGCKQLYLTIRGRERTKSFDFRIEASNLPIHVNGVQIETDAGYEGKRDIILVEAKIGIPSHFNIRQLYYPFRHFSSITPRKRVRTLFFAYNLKTATYSFYEFSFSKIDVFDSIQLKRCLTYSLIPRRSYKVESLFDSQFETDSKIVPQADDLNKVLELLTLINRGQNTTSEIADHFVFDKRQSNYYGEAAEFLGLITRNQGLFELTNRGKTFVTTPPEKQQLYAAKLIVNSWFFRELYNHSKNNKFFTDHDIEQIIAQVKKQNRQRYTHTTVSRRGKTITTWVKWLAEQFGIFDCRDSRYYWI